MKKKTYEHQELEINTNNNNFAHLGGPEKQKHGDFTPENKNPKEIGDFSFAHIMQDLKNLEKENDFMRDQSLVLDPNLDIKNTTQNQNFFNSDGYIEEEDDDQFTPEEEELLGLKTKLPEVLTNPNDLKLVLTNNRYESQKFKITLVKKILGDKEYNVIQEDFMMTILKFLFDELNDPMLEFSDNCAEDRRKFFDTNFQTYVKTIDLYIKKKNEFFSCVLSNLFYKLTINQEDFDNSVNYYINEAGENEEVIKIRDSYEKVFNVGKKEM